MSAQNVTINGYSLQDSVTFTSRINHETIGTDESKVKVSHRDGEKLVSSTFASRTITLDGYVLSPTASGLDGKIDEMKRNLIGATGVNLDLDYAGTTRRYTVNVKNFAVTRDYFNTQAAPFHLDVEALNPPFGQDTATISGISQTAISGTTTATVTLSGTASPYPLCRFVVTTAGSLTDIELRNLTTGTSIKVSPSGGSFTNGDVVEVDCRNYTVQRNSVPVSFTGTVPVFAAGNNQVQVLFYNSASQINVQQTDASRGDQLDSSVSWGQSFVPTVTGNYRQIDVNLRYSTSFPTPTQAVTVSLHSDNGGAPGSTLKSVDITAATISSSSSWISAIFSSAQALTSGTTYWIVLATSESAGEYVFGDVNTDVYPGGLLINSSNQGTNWNSITGDMAFKVYRDTTSAIDWTVGWGIQYTKWWL